MKQVNRKFLEEQVKKAIKEQAAPGQEKQLGALMTSNEPSRVARVTSKLFDVISLEDILFGAKMSRDLLINKASDIIDYGYGPNSHVKKALNETKGLTSFETFAFKFMKMAAPEGGGEISITYNTELFSKLFNTLEESAKELAAFKQKNDKDGVYSVIRECIQKKIFDDIFKEYGINDKEPHWMSVQAWSGLKGKPTKTAFPPSDELCMQWARQVVEKPSLSDNQAENFLNECLCYCVHVFTAGRNPTGKPIQHFSDFAFAIAETNIPKMVAATIVADYSRSIDWSDLLLAFTDVAISSIGTVSMVFTLGGSKALTTIGAGFVRATAKSFGQKALATQLRNNYLNAATKMGKVMQGGKQVFSGSALLGGGWSGSMLYLVAGLIPAFEMISRDLGNRLARLQGLHEAYWKLAETGQYNSGDLSSLSFTTSQLTQIKRAIWNTAPEIQDLEASDQKEKQTNEENLTPEQKRKTLQALLNGSSVFGESWGADIITVWSEIYDSLIKYNYEYLKVANQVPLANQILGEGQGDKETQLKKIKEAYAKGDKNETVARLRAVVSLYQTIQKQIVELEKRKEEIEKVGGDVDAANEKVIKKQQQMLQVQQLDLIENIPPSVLKAQQNRSKGQGKSQRFGPSPSVAKEIPTSFGSDEKTSDEIYREIVAAFSDTVSEGQEDNTVKVNLGYKDALEFAKGSERFNKEKTLANIEKIRSFLQNKGKQVSFTPIPILKYSDKGVDGDVDVDKFKDFAKEINTQLKTSKTSKIVAPVDKPTTEEPPSDREVTQVKDVSDLSGPEILIIGDSTSNNIVNSNKILQRGKYEARMGYYGADGTKFDPKDFGGDHNKAAKAARDAGGSHKYPGWSGHASHGGAGTTYIKNSLVKLLARDKSYVPKVAIISMGYNDPPSVSEKGTSINNFKSIISALKERGVKDIRIIEPRADKGNYKRNADLIRPGVYDLADSVVKIVPNPTTQDGGPPRGDGVHYTPSGARRLFKDAMSGLTVSSDVQVRPSGAKDAGSGTSTTSQPVQRTPTLRQNLESFGAALDPRVERLYYAFGKKAIGYEPSQFDLHARGITDLETANNSKRYMFVNPAGYIGKYQLNGDWWYTTLLSRIRKDHGLEDLIPEGDIGYAEPEKGRHKPHSWVKKGENKYGKRLSYKQFAKEIVKKDMWQIQELLWAAMQADNSGASKGMDQRTKAGYLAIGHNIGGPTADIWVKAKKDYLKTKDPRYLMKMWSMQDGNHTAGERFLRNSARKVYGAKFIKLPQGNHSVFADIYARETGKPKPRFMSKFGNSFNPNSKLEVYEEYWNRSTGNADIFKYYKKDGSPAGDAGSLDVGSSTSSTVTAVSAVPAPSADQQQAQQGQKPADQEKDQVITTKQALEKFNSRLDRISKIENFKELIQRFQILYGTSISEVIGGLVQLEKYVSNLDQGDLSFHRKAKFKELIGNVHNLNKEKLFALYKSEREKDLDTANSLMAFIHRPRLITYIPTNYLLYTNADGFNLSFELGPPFGNKVGVTLNEHDFFSNSNFGDSKEKAMLRRILVQNKETFEALYNKLESFEIGQIETDRLTEAQKEDYSKFLSSFITLFESGIDSLEDRGSSLRRSWKMDNLAAAIYLLS